MWLLLAQQPTPEWVTQLITGLGAGGSALAMAAWFITTLRNTIAERDKSIAEKDKQLEALQAERIADTKETSRQQHEALEHTLTVLTGAQHSIDAVVESVGILRPEIVNEVKDVGKQVGVAGEGIKELLRRADK